jgi:hypothetical protein
LSGQRGVKNVEWRTISSATSFQTSRDHYSP